MSNHHALAAPTFPTLKPLTGVLKEIPLSEIFPRPDLQPRALGIEEGHVEQLTTADWDLLPPPVVMPNEDGTYGEVGGCHTIAAARRVGRPSIKCFVVPTATYVDAFNLNGSHGLSLTSVDRKAYVRRLHHDEPALSYRELGRRAGLHHLTVKAALDNLDESPPATEQSAPPKPSVAEKMLNLMLRANDDAGKLNHSQPVDRAEIFQIFIKEYDNESQPNVAAILHTWGSAMQSAAQPFMSG